MYYGLQMDTTSLHARLMEDAEKYDPSAHNRGLLTPHRDVLLLWRAKFMSYEQIAAALNRYGLKVSPAGVGVYCRRTFTKEEILRERHRINSAKQASPAVASRPISTMSPTLPTSQSQRGPKIARDDL